MATAGEVGGKFQEVVQKSRQGAAAKARQLLGQKKPEATTKRRIALALPQGVAPKKG